MRSNARGYPRWPGAICSRTHASQQTLGSLNEAGGTRLLTVEELDEVNGGMGLLGLAILLTAAGVAGVCVGIY